MFMYWKTQKFKMPIFFQLVIDSMQSQSKHRKPSLWKDKLI